MKHKLYCIGCGPGDPELLTLKAKRLIDTCDTIFCPTSKHDRESKALSIVKPIINSRSIKPEIIQLVFPMVKDKCILEQRWEENAKAIADKCREGKRVVYLCVGDPSLYSTFSHIYKKLKAYEDIEVEIIPGIASILSFAAEAKISLAEGDDILAIIPACYDLSRAFEIAKASNTLIFLKDGRYFSNVMKILKDSKFKDGTIAIAEDVSIDDKIKVSKVKDINNIPVEKYFSLMVVKDE